MVLMHDWKMALGNVQKVKEKFISLNRLQQSLKDHSSITKNGIIGQFHRANVANYNGRSNVEHDASPNGSSRGNQHGTTNHTLGSDNMD